MCVGGGGGGEGHGVVYLLSHTFALVSVLKLRSSSVQLMSFRRFSLSHPPPSFYKVSLQEEGFHKGIWPLEGRGWKGEHRRRLQQDEEILQTNPSDLPYPGREESWVVISLTGVTEFLVEVYFSILDTAHPNASVPAAEYDQESSPEESPHHGDPGQRRNGCR